jgi:hypothetical protein
MIRFYDGYQKIYTGNRRLPLDAGGLNPVSYSRIKRITNYRQVYRNAAPMPANTQAGVFDKILSPSEPSRISLRVKRILVSGLTNRISLAFVSTLP